MKKVLLYGHGGAYNHGAEAIVKTTVHLLKEYNPCLKIYLVTHFENQDREYNLPVDGYFERNINVLGSEESNNPYHKALEFIDRDTICLSIGGDNYCYNNWHKWDVFLLRAKQVGAKSILWSASIEPNKISLEMLESLKLFDKITTREKRTYQALKKCRSLSEIDILDCADVAFLLPERKCDVIKDNKEYVVINISPLIYRTSLNQELFKKCIYNLLNYILEITELNILLLPHVMMPTDNDFEMLKTIYDRYRNTGRIQLIPNNLSVSEYKYLISKCRFGVLSRTHAMIAAYATGVPSIAIGYSIKALGIAEDFGMEGLLLDNHKINGKDNLTNLFKQLTEQEQDLRKKLHEQIGEIKKKAKKNIEAIDVDI